MLYACVFVSVHVCALYLYLDRKPGKQASQINSGEREVGRSGLEEEGTLFLINIIVNCHLKKMMDMNYFKNKLLFLSPRICGISVSVLSLLLLLSLHYFYLIPL